MKVWLSNIRLVEADRIMSAFPGVTPGTPHAAGGMSARELCKANIIGLYAPEAQAAELTFRLGDRNE